MLAQTFLFFCLQSSTEKKSKHHESLDMKPATQCRTRGRLVVLQMDSFEQTTMSIPIYGCVYRRQV